MIPSKVVNYPVLFWCPRSYVHRLGNIFLHPGNHYLPSRLLYIFPRDLRDRVGNSFLDKNDKWVKNIKHFSLLLSKIMLRKQIIKTSFKNTYCFVRTIVCRHEICTLQNSDQMSSIVKILSRR